MPVLPTRTTANTAAEHVTDHNTLHGLNNQLGNFTQSTTAPSSPVTADLWLDTDESTSTGLSSIIGYAERTTDQTGMTGTTDLTGLAVTVTVPAGRRIRVRGYAHYLQNTSASIPQLYVREGSTTLQTGIAPGGAVSENSTVAVEWIGSPSAGSHTYKLSSWTGAGTLDLKATAQDIAFILVEDITGTLWPAGQSIGAGTIASEAWTDYVPTLTNMTLGNGSVIARYSKIGRTVTVKFRFTLGSTSAMGTGPYFSLPFAVGTAFPSNSVLGPVFMTDISTNIYGGFAQSRSDGLSAQMRLYTTGGTYANFADITATIPFAWTNTYYIDTTFTYESAT